MISNQQQSTQINISDTVFIFVGVRKHFFKDVYYHIKITSQAIIMSQNETFLNPKYTIPLKLTTQIGFQRNTKKSFLYLKYFTFPYKGKRKQMHAKNDDLIKMMKLITNKVVFLEIYQFYEPCYIIGKGASARVMLVNDLIKNINYAVKSIDKKYLQIENNGMEALETEINILRQLSTNNTPQHFITLNAIYESQTSYYLVMDYMKGKSLHENLQKTKTRQIDQIPTIEDTKIIMKKILEGVNKMHNKKIIHRDLKPENILLSKSGSYESILISDFGLATFIDVDSYKFVKCGTPGYVAPEILSLKNKKQKYGPACDLFSCGIIFCQLLTGKFLFDDKDVASIMRQNKECKINFEDSMFQKIPKNALNLLIKLLAKNPSDRITAEEALKHYFFQNQNIQEIDDLQIFEVDECINLSIKQIPDIKRPSFQKQQQQLNGDVNVKNSVDSLIDQMSPYSGNYSIQSFYQKDPLSQVQKQCVIQNSGDNKNMSIFSKSKKT